MALVYLVATAKGADTGAYTLGRIAGRHKLWPSLSPKKTVEGAVGGLILSVTFALVVAAIARYVVQVPTFDWQQAAVLRARGRRRRPAWRLDGVDDQARLRAQGRLDGGARLRRRARRARFAHLRRTRRLWAVAVFRIVRPASRTSNSPTRPTGSEKLRQRLCASNLIQESHAKPRIV